MKYLISVVRAKFTCEDETGFVSSCSIYALAQPLELLLNYKTDTNPFYPPFLCLLREFFRILVVFYATAAYIVQQCVFGALNISPDLFCCVLLFVSLISCLTHCIRLHLDIFRRL